MLLFSFLKIYQKGTKISSYIDLILVIFLIYSAYRGYQVGFLSSLYRVLFILLSILLSLFLALEWKGLLYPGLLSSPYIAIIVLAIAFAILFRFLLKKVLFFLNSFLKKFDLLWLDGVLGVLLGLIKAYLIVFILISIIGSFGNRTLIKPFLHSTLSMHIYKQVRAATGFNLMHYLSELSLKRTLQNAKEGVDDTMHRIESTT